ncbi:serine hydrolase [Jatrophihabitans fulvus]
MTDLEAILAERGLRGFVHAVDIDSGAEVGLGADDVVVPASVFKIPILVELCRQWSAGELSPTQRVHLPAGELLTPGGTGFSIVQDDVDVSLRDLAVSMISVSDNRATDVVLGLVGLDAVNATMRSLGHPTTQLVGDCNFLFRTIAEDLGLDEPGEEPDPASMMHVRACRPGETTSTTPRETTRLLTQLWTDAVLDPEACARARHVLGTQIWPQRVGSGFPESDVRISGKTGTVGPWRTEAAVVETGGGRRVALAIFVVGTHAGPRDPVADAAIGALARTAVDALR